MTHIDLDTFVKGKIKAHPRKFEVRYPNETETIINLLKQAIEKAKDPLAYRYNYLTIAEYCREVLGYNMVSEDGLRKIIARIAKENGCEL